MEALETEEENRRWLIKQKRDAWPMTILGYRATAQELWDASAALFVAGRERRQFPKTDHMPDVLYGDQRPPPIPDKKCVITGKVASYKCPRTGIPYHDLAAFKELRRRNGLSDGPLRTNTVKDYELVDADDRINREKRRPRSCRSGRRSRRTSRTRGPASAFNVRARLLAKIFPSGVARAQTQKIVVYACFFMLFSAHA